MLSKQAKILSDHQIKAVMKYLESCPRNSLRNRVMFMLSLHGLRAKEVSQLQISMITDSTGMIGEAISLQDKASKGTSGRVIPINKILKELLSEYVHPRINDQDAYVVVTERSEKFSAHAVVVFFSRLYKKLGFVGCSSHSGRRSFITQCARRVSQAGGSIRDVMNLAGHRNLQTTQKYIEQNEEAQKALVKLIGQNW